MESDAENGNLVDQNVSKKPYKCNFEGCSLEFLKPSSLTWHMNVHLNKRPFNCTFEGCDKSYSNPSHLKRHTLTHDSTLKIKKYKCKYCTRYYTNTSNLKRHVDRTHTDTAKFCILCDRIFRKESTYEEHIIMFHKLQGRDLKAYECEQCGNVLLTFKAFKRHQKIHLKNNYSCPFKNCSAEFNSKVSLVEHKRSYHVLQYSCADCDQKFYSKDKIKSHVVTHLEKRTTFPCTYKMCTRIYYFKRNLIQHIHLFHMGRRFKCDICKFEFSSNQKLNQHKTRFHENKEKALKRRSPKRKSGIEIL